MPRNLTSLLLALSLTLAACSPATPTARAGTLRVIATFSILGDLVQNVGGEHISLRTLVGPDGDTHSYDPSPADSAALAEADLIFENGLGFESWLEEQYTAARSGAQRVVVTQGLQPATITAGAEAGETDPHIWQDVNNTIQMVQVIRDALAQRDPANAAAYRANAGAYLEQLRQLDAAIIAKVASLPAARRKLITNHDSLGYFAARYGFTLIGNVLGSLSTETGDPSAAKIAALVEAIKAAETPAIFTENAQNAAVIQQVAREAGVVVAPPLYTDALGKPGSAGDSYLKMMRYNINTIVSALK